MLLIASLVAIAAGMVVLRNERRALPVKNKPKRNAKSAPLPFTVAGLLVLLVCATGLASKPTAWLALLLALMLLALGIAAQRGKRLGAVVVSLLVISAIGALRAPYLPEPEPLGVFFGHDARNEELANELSIATAELALLINELRQADETQSPLLEHALSTHARLVQLAAEQPFQQDQAIAAIEHARGVLNLASMRSQP